MVFLNSQRYWKANAQMAIGFLGSQITSSVRSTCLPWLRSEDLIDNCESLILRTNEDFPLFLISFLLYSLKLRNQIILYPKNINSQNKIWSKTTVDTQSDRNVDANHLRIRFSHIGLEHIYHWSIRIYCLPSAWSTLCDVLWETVNNMNQFNEYILNISFI